MRPRRILIVNIHSLLIEGVESILNSQGNGRFEVISTYASDISNLLQDVNQREPSVIVVDEVTSFIEPAKLIMSVMTRRFVRLIVLNSQTSTMDIYDKRVSRISGPEHLMEALDVRMIPIL